MVSLFHVMMLECWFFVKDSPLSNTLHNVGNVELYIFGTPMDSNYASGSVQNDAVNINAQTPPAAVKKTKKKATDSSAVFITFSITCIVFAVLLCLMADPWSGMSTSALGFAITLGFLAVVLQLISIGITVRRINNAMIEDMNRR